MTYEGFAEAWPPREGEFADKMNAMPKYVAVDDADRARLEDSTILEAAMCTAVADLKQGDGGPILVAGSATLAHALIEHEPSSTCSG